MKSQVNKDKQRVGDTILEKNDPEVIAEYSQDEGQTRMELIKASLSKRDERFESLENLDDAYLKVKENILAVKTPQREDNRKVANKVKNLPIEGQWPKFLPKSEEQPQVSSSGVYSYFVDEVVGQAQGKRVPYHVFNKMIGTTKHSPDNQLYKVSAVTNQNVQNNPCGSQGCGGTRGLVGTSSLPKKICPSLCLTEQGRRGYDQVSSYGGCFDNHFVKYLGGKVRNC